MDEFDLIDGLIAPLAVAPGAQGLANDGATLSVSPGCELVLTKDMMAAGVHFLEDDPANLVARKLLRVNLSDLAAMGAKPVGYLLGLASDGRREESWLKAFFDGLMQDQTSYAMSLFGGDIISSSNGVLTLSLTAFGEVPKGRSLARSGAMPGDLIAVTGTIGDATLGLGVLQEERGGVQEECRAYLSDRYRLPRPRTQFGPRLVSHAHCALDVSDGLVSDAGHLARRSGVAMELQATDIPLSACVRGVLASDPSAFSNILGGGDDYELLFTFSPDELEGIRNLADECGLDVTIIGKCQEGEGVRVLDADGGEMRVEGSGWHHKG